MQKFIAIYMAPAAIIEEWMKKPEAERREEEQKMKGEWDMWANANTNKIQETNAAGKNMRVTKDGVSPAANDIMLYSIVEAETQEEAAVLFKEHPHFGIPGATIDIMPIQSM